MRILRQVQLSLQSQFVLHLLLAEIVNIILLLDMGVRCRVIIIVVDTVDDTG